MNPPLRTIVRVDPRMFNIPPHQPSRTSCRQIHAYNSALEKLPLEQRIWISHKRDMQAPSLPRRIGMKGHLLTLSM